MKIKLLVDSTSSIPRKFLEDNGISVLEISILHKEECKKEISEIDIHNFTENFETMNPIPTTSFASPHDALEVFNEAIEEASDLILYPYMTTKISNQVNSARLGFKKVKDKIRIDFYPTQLAGPSQAPFILYALKMIEEKKNVDQIIDFFDSVKHQIYTIGVSRDFSTLFRTGKVKKNVQMSFLTTLLNLKPLCEILIDQGVIGFGGGIGFNGALKKIKRRINEVTKSETTYDIIISHSNDLEKAKELEREVRKIRNINETTIWSIPPAIVCTVGKGAVMVTMYPTYESSV